MRSKKSLSLGMPQNPKLLSKESKQLSLGMPRVASPLSKDQRYFTRSYIFIRHILCVLLGASCMIWDFPCFILCFKSWFLAGHTYLRELKLCHDLLELWYMPHLNFYELWTFSSASLISFISMVCFSIFEEMLSCFTQIFLRLSKFLKKFSLASLKLIWEKEILCSWSSLIFVWAYQKQHMKISSKVIDIQDGYNKNFHEDHWTK